MLFDSLYQEVFDQLTLELGKDVLVASKATLEIPPELDMGDFAFPTFKFAKALKKAPPLIASEIAQKLSQNIKINTKYEISTLGAYVNFKVKKDFTEFIFNF